MRHAKQIEGRDSGTRAPEALTTVEPKKKMVYLFGYWQDGKEKSVLTMPTASLHTLTKFSVYVL